MNEWFARWFGQEYLELYPHRNDDDARALLSLIRRELSGVTPAHILDLACGSGRHSRALLEWGWTVGLDLSQRLLDVAQGSGASYVRGDMRVLPFAAGAFDVVVNLFTSYGYFESDAEHLTVLQEVSRVTRPGGWFVLDYLNADYVRATLVPENETIVNGKTIQQRRIVTADDRFVLKTISVMPEGHEYVERVRLYRPDDLQTMLHSVGFKVVQTFGDYAGLPLTSDAPRAILFAERQ